MKKTRLIAMMVLFATACNQPLSSDVEPKAVCGNGIVEPGEECDGNDIPSCSDLGHTTGRTRCTDTCSIDESLCTTCGDGVMEGNEGCDIGDLRDRYGNQAACSDFVDFVGGNLACDAVCHGYDFSGCY